MVKMHSALVPLGTPLPPTTLPDLNGTHLDLSDVRGTGVLVVLFACNHCPYVRHIEQAFGEFAAANADKASIVAICSNDPEAYPDDDIPGLREQTKRAHWDFPYLVDVEQTAAKDFGAVCTPDIFVYDKQGRLGYRGAFDDSTPGNDIPPTGSALQAAVDALADERPAAAEQKPAMGCSIKWRR